MGKGISVLSVCLSFFNFFSNFFETRSQFEQSQTEYIAKDDFELLVFLASFSSAGLVSPFSGLGIEPRTLHMPDKC